MGGHPRVGVRLDLAGIAARRGDHRCRVSRRYTPLVPDLTWTRAVALAAFVGTYLGIALGRLPGFRVDRTGVTIIGAAVMVVAGGPPGATR